MVTIITHFVQLANVKRTCNPYSHQQINILRWTISKCQFLPIPDCWENRRFSGFVWRLLSGGVFLLWCCLCGRSTIGKEKSWRGLVRVGCIFVNQLFARFFLRWWQTCMGKTVCLKQCYMNFWAIYEFCNRYMVMPCRKKTTKTLRHKVDAQLIYIFHMFVEKVSAYLLVLHLHFNLAIFSLSPSTHTHTLNKSSVAWRERANKHDPTAVQLVEIFRYVSRYMRQKGNNWVLVR